MHKKLVAYITSGLPDNSFTIDLALAMADAGVDSIELGIPFSDPVADGPIIERANLTALQQGVTFADVKAISRVIAPIIDTLWMGYFNSFYHQGMEKLLQEAQAMRLSGMIIPDLPYEEAVAYAHLFAQHHVANITFVAPTDSDARIATLVENAQKFIYLVAYAGITGSGQSEELEGVVASIRTHTATPVYVGFGVNAQTARDKARGVDGVIVGSAFVDILLRDALSQSAKIDAVAALAREIKEKINS
ncbi:MAG: tryptophan synthase susbunit alpha [Sulfuricurvum sp. PC08-66]|nr:MAG: tryptophan synthase susbunit alpha [Sulfuricurvum sp. PC08-66]